MIVHPRTQVKKHELETTWSIDDCEEAHAVLDALDEADAVANR